MDWKTEQEWVIMRYFKENCHGFPKGKLVKGESPDFQLWLSPKRFIGIELTQVGSSDPDNPFQGYFALATAANHVAASIRAKEEKIHFYQKDHPFQLWLIIFADYSEPDAMEKAAIQFQTIPVETAFNKIYLFDLDTHKAVRIT